MRQDLTSGGATPAGSTNSGLERAKHVVIASALTIAVMGCSSPPSLNVVAYNACISRHSQEPAVCTAPRQAYELDTSTYQATAQSARRWLQAAYREATWINR